MQWLGRFGLGRVQAMSRIGKGVACAINDCSDIIDCMASITIRNLEETTKRKLKIRAAMHGHSMEQEARDVLNSALKSSASKSGANLAEAIHRRFAPFGGVELEPFPRGPIREPGFE
jgi:plasmid stability protein